MKEFPELPHSMYDRPLPNVELCMGVLARVFADYKEKFLPLTEINFLAFKRLGIKHEPYRTPSVLYEDNVDILYRNIFDALNNLIYIDFVGVKRDTIQGKQVKIYFLTEEGRLILSHEPYIDNDVFHKYMGLKLSADDRNMRFSTFLKNYFKNIEKNKTKNDE